MKRVAIQVGVFCVAVLLAASIGMAENKVTVETLDLVAPGATGVELGVYLTNDVDLTSMQLPLEFRSDNGGAFVVNNFSFAVQGRLAASPLASGFVTKYYYPAPLGSNSCSGPLSSTFQVPAGSASGDFFTSPSAVQWTGLSTGFDCLTVGTDPVETPSLLFTFDVNSSQGWFVIDSCCITPANHIQFVDCATYERVEGLIFEFGAVGINVEADVMQTAGGGSSVPRTFAIEQNYPNPFNASTVIPFEVAYQSHVQIEVYNILGRHINTLVDGDYAPGRYAADWDGTDGNGRSVATGVYFYRFISDELVSTRKMVILK
jgi:hypothetical protein